MNTREVADMVLYDHEKFVYRVYFGKQFLDIATIMTDVMLYGLAYDMILRGDY